MSSLMQPSGNGPQMVPMPRTALLRRARPTTQVRSAIRWKKTFRSGLRHAVQPTDSAHSCAEVRVSSVLAWCARKRPLPAQLAPQEFNVNLKNVYV